MSESDDGDQGTRTDREAILARRRRFVAAALTGITTSTLATACPCLKIAPEPPLEPQGDGQPKDDGDSVEEASPEEAGAEGERSDGEGGDGGESEPSAGEDVKEAAADGS